MENEFNLIDEKWIPSNIGLVSLMDCFSNDSINSVGRNSIEKISIIKLLSAISHTSNFFENLEMQLCMNISDFRKNIIEYLEKKHDLFYLYGDKPFCQFPVLINYKDEEYKTYGRIIEFISEISVNNNAVVFIENEKRKLTDSDKALTLIRNIGCGLKIKTNKSTKKTFKLTKDENYKKFFNGEKITENLCECNAVRNGVMHGFIFFNSIIKTLFYNMFNNEDIIEKNPQYSNGIGLPIWEKEISGENDESYINSYMSELMPFNRFMLFEKETDNFFRTEGIVYNEIRLLDDFSLFKKTEKEKFKNIVCSTDVHPLNSIDSCLSYNNGHWNKQIENSIFLANKFDEMDEFYIWVGGGVVSNNSGCTYFDGYKESFLSIKNKSYINGEEIRIENFFNKLINFSNVKKIVIGKILNFYDEVFSNKNNSKKESMVLNIMFNNMFYFFLEKNKQKLFNSFIEENNEIKEIIYRKFCKELIDLYGKCCKNEFFLRLNLTNKIKNGKKRKVNYFEYYFKNFPNLEYLINIINEK